MPDGKGGCMCGDAACFQLSEQTGATYHRTGAPWIDWKVWCKTLGVDPELTVKGKAVIASHHFLPKYFRESEYKGGQVSRVFIDKVGRGEEGMPIPTVSFHSIRSAIPTKAHPMARAAGLEATAAAAKLHAPGSAARRTRATSATAKETEHLASAATTVAQRLETLAADREPAVDRARRSKKAAVPAKKPLAKSTAKKRQRKQRKKAQAPAPDPEAWSQNGPRLSFEMLQHDEKTRRMCTNLTGMPSADVCVKFYELLNVGGRAEKLLLYNYRGDGNASGRGAGDGPKNVREGSRAMKAPDAYLMTLVMLNKGLDQQFTAWLFGVNERTLSVYFITWLQFLKEFLQVLMPFPTREQIDETTPPRYQEVYGEAPRMILDAMEIALENPKQLENYRACFSDYKHRTTAKMLGAISPAGAMVYCSSAYPGRITDQKLTEVSGVMDVLEPGDAMAADKGFNIDALMLSIGCKVIHPPKRRRGKKPHTPEAAMDTAEQANLRIHVERAFARVKTYGILKNQQRIVTCDLLGSVFYVVAMLTNFSLPLVSKDWRSVTAERAGVQVDNSHSVVGKAPVAAPVAAPAEAAAVKAPSKALSVEAPDVTAAPVAAAQGGTKSTNKRKRVVFDLSEDEDSDDGDELWKSMAGETATNELGRRVWSDDEIDDEYTFDH